MLFGLVAQLVRAPPCHGGGRRFKSVLGRFGVLAQLGEHLPYKQRVIGSSPIGPIELKTVRAGVAELADAQDLKSCGSNIVPVRFRSPAVENFKDQKWFFEVFLLQLHFMYRIILL